MIFEIGDDNLSLKLTPEFLAELRALLQTERELHKEASEYYKSLDKRLTENHEAFQRWENKLEAEVKTQTQSRA